MFIPCVSDNYYRSIHTPFVASPPLPNKPYLFHIEGGGYLGSFIGEKEAETEWLVLEIEGNGKIRATFCLRRNETGPATRMDFYTEGNP